MHRSWLAGPGRKPCMCLCVIYVCGRATPNRGAGKNVWGLALNSARFAKDRPGFVRMWYIYICVTWNVAYVERSVKYRCIQSKLVCVCVSA